MRLFPTVLLALWTSSLPAAAQWQYAEDPMFGDFIIGEVESGDYRLEVGCWDLWEDGYDEDTFDFYTPIKGDEAQHERLKARKPAMVVTIDGVARSFEPWVTRDEDGAFGLIVDTDKELYDALAAAARSIDVTVTVSDPTEIFASRGFTTRNSTAVLRKVWAECW